MTKNERSSRRPRQLRIRDDFVAYKLKQMNAVYGPGSEISERWDELVRRYAAMSFGQKRRRKNVQKLFAELEITRDADLPVPESDYEWLRKEAERYKRKST